MTYFDDLISYEKFSQTSHERLFKHFLDLNQTVQSQRSELESQRSELESQRSELESQRSELDFQKNYSTGLEEKIIEVNGQLILLRQKLFGKSSEKEKKPKDKSNEKGKNRNPGKKRGKREKTKLSERYADLPITEMHVELKNLPTCSCCSTTMRDSGMTEESEFLNIVPAQYSIIRQLRHKYRCTGCHGQITTAPAIPRIIPGSAYSDEMIQDVAMSKYCDLIPIDRYSAIAGRSGVVDLPPNSLIGLTHGLANFVLPAYEKLKAEILSSIVLQADETPHKMLEGDDKSHWFLWGFTDTQTCYMEIHDTRSGDIASGLLTESACEYLVSDVFSGYQKAVRQTNEIRAQLQRPLIKNVYCNAHSRRKFKEAMNNFPEESEFFILRYRKIYVLEAEGKAQPDVYQDKREAMAPLFAEMKAKAESLLESSSSKSALATACKYFLNNYNELTLFLKNVALPIDNNLQERLLRNSVVGRKTWYGTHSRRGARTAAILFSLVESCKLNKINPRLYFKALTESIHRKGPVFTPREYIVLNL